MKVKTEIVRIQGIYKIENFRIFCYFTNSDYRYIDFEDLFKQWGI